MSSLCGLTQLVTSPTHNQNILDVLLATHPQNVLNMKVTEPFLFSDHNSLCFEVPWNLSRQKVLYKNVRNMKAGNYDEIQKVLNRIDWHDMFMECDGNIEEFWCRMQAVFFLPRAFGIVRENVTRSVCLSLSLSLSLSLFLSLSVRPRAAQREFGTD